MRLRLSFFLIAICLPVFLSAQRARPNERELIRSGTSDTKMRVLQATASEDLFVLKQKALKISPSNKRLWKKLSQRMLATVTDPVHPGVGVAAPQVGISRRLILVQRFDKEDNPFQVMINPVITAFSDSTWKMAEGCLSIPGVRQAVSRPWQISLKYQNIDGQEFTETVSGFTARIILHENDHLNGILITDHMDN